MTIGNSLHHRPSPILSLIHIFVEDVYMDEKIEKYIIDIIFATREPAEYNLQKLQNLIAYGGSPRASISLAKAARCLLYTSPKASNINMCIL